MIRAVECLFLCLFFVELAWRRGGEGRERASRDSLFIPPRWKFRRWTHPPRFRESSRCLIRRVSDESLNDRFRRWLRCGVRLIATNCGTLQCGRGRGMKGNEVAFHFAYHLCSRGGIIDASLRMFRGFSLGRGKFRSVFRSSGILERSKIDNSRDKNRFLSKCNNKDLFLLEMIDNSDTLRFYRIDFLMDKI